MAVCEICGNKTNILTQAYLTMPVTHQYLNMCKKCEGPLNNLLEPTEENVEQAKQYMSQYISRPDMNPEVRDYLSFLCNDASEKLEAKRKMSEEIKKQLDVRKELEQRNADERQEALMSRSDNMREFIMTTGNAFEGYRVVKYITIVTGESVIGTGLLSETGATVTDVMGTKSVMYEEKFSFAEADALNMLKEKALNVGANALLSVQFNITTLSMRNTIVAMASGTAVRVEKLE